MSNIDPTVTEPAVRRPHPRAPRPFVVARASRLVAAMKMLLPAIALCLVALVVIWPQLLRDAQDIPLGGKPINASDADTLRVSNPRYVGVDEQERPFEIIAASARQESESANAVHLQKPQADMITDKGDWVSLTAGEGIWHKREDVVDLSEGVSVFHEAGHQLLSDTARINLKAGTAESDDQTHGQSPGGNVEGEGFRLYDRGARIVFTGKAKAVLYGSGTSG